MPADQNPGSADPGERSIVIMLARPRSGTTALRSAIEQHPAVFCTDEVFRVSERVAKSDFIRETNFYRFLEQYCNGDVSRAFPGGHGAAFAEYLQYLESYTPKTHVLIDVKYSTMHLLVRPYQLDRYPYLFELIMHHRLRLLNVTRRNYLRCYLSLRKATDSMRWAVATEDEPEKDRPIDLHVPSLLSFLKTCAFEDELVQDFFKEYSLLWTVGYDEIFPDATGVIGGAFLQRLAAWLGVSKTFPRQPLFRKQSHLPLRAAIRNYAEVAAALQGTRFENCLRDERAYT